MRVATGLALLAVPALLAACGGGGRSPATDIAILAVNPNVGRAAFHLRCGPAGGDVADPARACAALAASPRLITKPKPFVCWGGPASWWDVTFSGRLDGRPVRRHFSTCWTPQMRTLGRLGIAQGLRAHLLPRRRERIMQGESATFVLGQLRPGDAVTCFSHRHPLEIGVPLGPGTPEVGWGRKGGTMATLRITRHGDGSVTATCS